jgi:hypothetical protein
MLFFKLKCINNVDFVFILFLILKLDPDPAQHGPDLQPYCQLDFFYVETYFSLGF